jgi:hypothetical protein
MTTLVINYKSNHEHNEQTILDFFEYHTVTNFLNIKDYILEAWINGVFSGREVMDLDNYSVVWKMTFTDEDQKQIFVDLINAHLGITDINITSCLITIEDETYYDNVASTVQDKPIELIIPTPED